MGIVVGLLWVEIYRARSSAAQATRRQQSWVRKEAQGRLLVGQWRTSGRRALCDDPQAYLVLSLTGLAPRGGKTANIDA